MKKQEEEISKKYDFFFQMLNADFGNLEFWGKSATNPAYCLLFVNLFTSKVYVYLMKSRKSIANKIKIFYKEAEGEKKAKKNKA